ncbi:MAG: hypothetical protein U0792_11030 [Gemmataceae bacterium]
MAPSFSAFAMNGREINAEVGAGKKGTGSVVEDVMKKKGAAPRISTTNCSS